MPAWIRRFLTAVVALGVLLGLAAAFVQLQLDLLVVALLAIAAAMYSAWPSARAAWIRWRRYPEVAADLQLATERATALEDELRAAQDKIEEAYLEGIKEGIRDIVGALLSSEATPPTLIAVSRSAGQLTLVGRASKGTSLAVGTRFAMRSRAGDLIGIVQIVSVDAEDILMVPAERTDTPYWDSLGNRPPSDLSAPSGVILTTYEGPLVRLDELLESEIRGEEDGD